MSTNPIELADILDRAADHIDAHGWYQGDLYDSKPIAKGVPLAECPVCLLGALNVAIHGSPSFPAEGFDSHDVADYVASRLGIGASENVAEWNDAPDRTQAEVTAALRETAAELRDGAA